MRGGASLMLVLLGLALASAAPDLPSAPSPEEDHSGKAMSADAAEHEKVAAQYRNEWTKRYNAWTKQLKDQHQLELPPGWWSNPVYAQPAIHPATKAAQDRAMSWNQAPGWTNPAWGPLAWNMPWSSGVWGGQQPNSMYGVWGGGSRPAAPQVNKAVELVDEAAEEVAWAGSKVHNAFSPPFSWMMQLGVDAYAAKHPEALEYFDTPQKIASAGTYMENAGNSLLQHDPARAILNAATSYAMGVNDPVNTLVNSLDPTDPLRQAVVTATSPDADASPPLSDTADSSVNTSPAGSLPQPPAQTQTTQSAPSHDEWKWWIKPHNKKDDHSDESASATMQTNDLYPSNPGNPGIPGTSEGNHSPVANDHYATTAASEPSPTTTTGGLPPTSTMVLPAPPPPPSSQTKDTRDRLSSTLRGALSTAASAAGHPSTGTGDNTPASSKFPFASSSAPQAAPPKGGSSDHDGVASTPVLGKGLMSTMASVARGKPLNKSSGGGSGAEKAAANAAPDDPMTAMLKVGAKNFLSPASSSSSGKNSDMSQQMMKLAGPLIAKQLGVPPSMVDALTSSPMASSMLTSML